MKDTFVLQHILNKLEKLDEKFDIVVLDQKEIKLDLNYHIHRTDLLEQQTAEQAHLIEENRRLLNLIAAPFRFVRWLLQLIKIVR